MRSSRTARKLVGAIGATVVSALLLGGTVAATVNDDAGRGINGKGTVSTSTVSSNGRGI